MDKQRQLGTILMAVAGGQMLVFLVGVMRRSYLAIALPVVAAVTGVCGVLFWVGYTMSTMKPGIGDLDMEEEAEVERQEIYS